MISVYLLLDSALAVFLFVVRLQNGFISRHTTQTQNASTNGGDASRVGHFSAVSSRIGKMQLLFNGVSINSFYFPDARRVAPIRGSVW